MQKVRYLQGMGEVRGPGIVPGEVREVSDEEAERLFEKDIAEPYDGEADSDAPAGSKKAPEPYKGYEDAGVDEVVEKLEDLSLAQLVDVERAERRGEKRKGVLGPLKERLALAEDALAGPNPVEVPDGVTPGETPGWPVNEDGDPFDLPDQVREELAALATDIEAKEAEVKDAKETETATSAAADAAATTSSAKAGKAKTKKSKKAASAKKRS